MKHLFFILALLSCVLISKVSCPAPADIEKLSGPNYFPAVDKALNSAKKSISIVMYYVEYNGRTPRKSSGLAMCSDVPEEQNNKVCTLLRDLVKAKERGVSVSVILDRTAIFTKDAIKGKRMSIDGKNMPAFYFLKRHGVAYDYINIKESNLAYGSLSLYPIAGSFVKFLIENYVNGREKFLLLLEQTKLAKKNEKVDYNRFKDAVEKIYGVKFKSLIDNWNNVLKPYWSKEYKIDNSDIEEIQAILSKNGYGKIKNVYYESFPRFLKLAIVTEKDKKIFVEGSSDGWRIL